MSNITPRRGATVVAAAMAAVLAAASPPSEATNGGLSAKQIRAIIKQEVEKIPRVRGPKGNAGPRGPMGVPGPAGMDGATFLSARVDASGDVVDGTSNGITSENVRLDTQLITPEEGDPFFVNSYCFSGLPPVVSGQVTLQGVRLPIISVPYLVVETEETQIGDCAVNVYIAGQSGFLEAATFHVMLY